MSKKGDEELEKSRFGLEALTIEHQQAIQNESVPINRLPVEVFCAILEHSELSDLLAYESVCRRWCYCVQLLVGRKLVIAKADKIRRRTWFYLDELCPIRPMMARGLDAKLISSSFMFNLKQLKICNTTRRVNDEQEWRLLQEEAVFLNRLVDLEMLEVCELGDQHWRSMNITIDLPNLKHLAINRMFIGELRLDCPKLLSFKTKENPYRVDFLHPLSLTHLYVGYFIQNCKLQNLEYLSVSGFDFSRSDKERRIFSSFPKLKQISLRPDSPAYSKNQKTFIELLREKQDLKRTEAVLTFCGIRLEDEEQLGHPVLAHEQPYTTHTTSSKFLDLLSGLYLRNYAKLDEKELRWTKRIGFSGLLTDGLRQEQRLQIPADFHTKFRHVREVRISNSVQNESQLLEFLRGFVRLNSLRIEKAAQLGSSFYRRLASIGSSNRSLAICMQPHDGITSFDFIFEFKNLVAFTTQKHEFDDQFIRRLFKHFAYFELGYTVEQNELKISRQRGGREFEFTAGPGHLETFDDLDELLVLINDHCRTKPEPGHRCNPDCIFGYCPFESYAENYFKIN